MQKLFIQIHCLPMKITVRHQLRVSLMADFQDSQLTLPFILLATLFFLVRAIVHKTRTKARLPPGPRALPIIGHLHLLSKIPHQSLHKLSICYGPLIQLFLGSTACVVVSSPEIAKQFLKTHESCFLNRPKRTNINYLTYNSSDFTFSTYGPYWKFMKKLCMTQILGRPTLDLHVPTRQEEMKHFLTLILKKAEMGLEVDIGEEVKRLSNNIISRMVLRKRSYENEDEAEEVSKLVEEMSRLAGEVNLADMFWFCKKMDLQGFGKRLKNVRDKYDRMMEKIMKEHEQERNKRKKMGGGDHGVEDLLDVLLDVYEDESSEIKLTRENIKAFVMNIFAAGTDTSATTVVWALAELINNPQVMSKARQEINSIVGETRVLQESDIPNLAYLQAIVKETFRLHPTAPIIIREAAEDCIINSYNISSKTRLFINVWAIGRDPSHWPDPLEFRPERFVSEDGSLKKEFDLKGQNFYLMPFGSGRRSCPGASLALEVIQMTLGAMIQCFEWKVGNGFRVDMEEAPGISLPRAHPLVCVPVLRVAPFPSI